MEPTAPKQKKERGQQNLRYFFLFFKCLTLNGYDLLIIKIPTTTQVLEVRLNLTKIAENRERDEEENREREDQESN